MFLDKAVSGDPLEYGIVAIRKRRLSYKPCPSALQLLMVYFIEEMLYICADDLAAWIILDEIEGLLRQHTCAFTGFAEGSYGCVEAVVLNLDPPKEWELGV